MYLTRTSIEITPVIAEAFARGALVSVSLSGGKDSQAMVRAIGELGLRNPISAESAR